MSVTEPFHAPPARGTARGAAGIELASFEFDNSFLSNDGVRRVSSRRRAPMGVYGLCLCAFVGIALCSDIVLRCKKDPGFKLDETLGHVMAILTSAFMIWRSKSDAPPPETTRIVVASLILCFSVLVALLVYASKADVTCNYAGFIYKVPHTANVATMFALCLPASVLYKIGHPTSHSTRACVLLIVVMWFEKVIVCFWGLSRCFTEKDVKKPELLITGTLRTYVMSVNRLNRFWEAVIIERRASLLEESLGIKMHTWIARFCLGLQGALGAVWTTYMSKLCLVGEFPKLFFASEAVARHLEDLFVYVVLRAFIIPYMFVRKALPHTRGVPKVEARWASHTLLREFLVILLCFGTPNIVGHYIQYYTSWPNNIYLVEYLGLVMDILRTYTIAAVSGVLFDFRPSQHSPTVASSRTACQPVSPQLNRQLSRVGTDERLWAQKVEDLAGRGFTLEALLHFFIELLKMPNFDPERSLTNDVVRLVIIPSSRDVSGERGSALASVWNKGQPVFPQKMVTHNWSNKFTALVAAVVADALGKDTYGSIFSSMRTHAGIERLKERLRKRGNLLTTYWICAISVNQHSGICGGFGPEPEDNNSIAWRQWDFRRRDSTSGAIYPICDCRTSKHFDGVMCEMNKFDDMMEYLHKISGNLVQIVAVDEKFDLFWRAWCQAELVEADKLALEQSIKIHSAEAFESKCSSLHDLDIENCEASRPEDKRDILKKIGDEDARNAFNNRLQSLIFSANGLFRGWMDPDGRMRGAARIVARDFRDSVGSDQASSTTDVHGIVGEVPRLERDSNSQPPQLQQPVWLWISDVSVLILYATLAFKWYEKDWLH